MASDRKAKQAARKQRCEALEAAYADLGQHAPGKLKAQAYSTGQTWIDDKWADAMDKRRRGFEYRDAALLEGFDGPESISAFRALLTPDREVYNGQHTPIGHEADLRQFAFHKALKDVANARRRFKAKLESKPTKAYSNPDALSKAKSDKPATKSDEIVTIYGAEVVVRTAKQQKALNSKAHKPGAVKTTKL